MIYSSQKSQKYPTFLCKIIIKYTPYTKRQQITGTWLNKPQKNKQEVTELAAIIHQTFYYLKNIRYYFDIVLRTNPPINKSLKIIYKANYIRVKP